MLRKSSDYYSGSNSTTKIVQDERLWVWSAVLTVYSFFFTALLIGRNPLSDFFSSFHFIHMHLCEKLCVNHNVSCRYYRKRGSASYIVREVLSVRERERERVTERDTDRERRKWRHHCRAKIGDEITLSLAKISHFSFLPSHFPSLPSRRGHHGGAEIRNEFTLSIAKVFSPSGFVPPLSNGTIRATSDRKPKTNDQILPSPIFLPIKKMNQITTKNYWK